MKIQKWLVAAILSGIFSTTLLAAGEKLDTARIDELTGLKGKMNEKEGVYKVTFPRGDVKVAVTGWEMPPFMGLGTWAAFEGTNDIEKGLPPGKSSISAEPLNKIFGMQGEAKDGMVKFTIGRPAKMAGMTIDKEMGVNTWAAFAGSDNDAVVDGDFAVTENELQPVLKSLRIGGINIVAIHSHMTHENPRILFFHYWGRGSAKELANTLKGGLLAAGLSGVSTSIGN